MSTVGEGSGVGGAGATGAGASAGAACISSSCLTLASSWSIRRSNCLTSSGLAALAASCAPAECAHAMHTAKAMILDNLRTDVIEAVFMSTLMAPHRGARARTGRSTITSVDQAYTLGLGGSWFGARIRPNRHL